MQRPGTTYTARPPLGPIMSQVFTAILQLAPTLGGV